MQQRYCDCGCSIYVQYQIFETFCSTIFWNNAFGIGQYLTHCPVCGRSLNINSLR